MKVLIISHNSFSTCQSMGKTFLSLFSAFGPEELCQLYIYPNIPDVKACRSSYRVTDRDVLTSLRPGGEVDSRRIPAESGAFFERPEDAAIYRRKSNKKASRRLLRDAVWKLSRWNNGKLRDWLDRERPTCIFLAPGYAKFIYDIALEISESRSIPIVTYLCDDYYFVREPETALGRLQLSLLRKKTEELMKRTARLVTISREANERYAKRFGVPAVTIMTGTNEDPAAEISVKEQPRSICYFGNIGCGRYTSLARVGKALDRMNREIGTEFTLELYTAETDASVLSAFRGIGAIRLRGFVSGEKFREAMGGADLLLHTEGFDSGSVDLVKCSVSTKIAESLGSGIPLIAYGPERVASMRHLIRNDCALTATTEQELEDTLRTAFFDRAERERVAANALKTAGAYHDSRRNSGMLRQILEEL